MTDKLKRFILHVHDAIHNNKIIKTGKGGESRTFHLNIYVTDVTDKCRSNGNYLFFVGEKSNKNAGSLRENKRQTHKTK